jgi:hypothetical protein
MTTKLLPFIPTVDRRGGQRLEPASVSAKPSRDGREHGGTLGRVHGADLGVPTLTISAFKTAHAYKRGPLLAAGHVALRAQ